MELKFGKTTISCLDTVVQEVQNSEQTQEIKLTDGMPDIGHVLSAWGQTILRGKEWRADTVSFSALLIVPVLLTIICFTGILIERNFRLIKFYFACMICPVLYGAAYFAYVKGYLSILVRQ